MLFLIDKTDFIPQLINYVVYFIEFFICIFMLTIRYKKKKHFARNVLIYFLITILVTFILSITKAYFSSYEMTFINISIRILSSLVLTALEIMFLFFCFDESKLELLICELYFSAVNSLSGTSFSMLLNILGKDDTKTISLFSTPLLWRDFAILAVHHLIIFIVFAIIYYHRQIIKSFSKSTFNVTILLFIAMIMESIIDTFSRIFSTQNIGSAIIIKTYILVISLLILFLIMMILRNNTVITDLEITEELLYKEKKNYEISKQNIESINAMVHDFKHTLHHIQDKVNDDELDSIKKSIKLYELNIKTGNQILDSIIFEKQIVCANKKIQLTCMANGSSLSFIAPYHLYSLFGNALDNAIEAVSKVSDVDKKIIGISVTQDSSYIYIEIYNYFTNDIYDITSKKDINHHGYGLKNIEYVANLYNGKLEINKSDDMFSLLISFPIINTKNTLIKK